MADTTNLSLPMLAAAQAQKHVTVNEALARLDGLTQLCLKSRTITIPPVASDGETYAVPTGAQHAWAGQEGKVAIFSNGGWVFATPQIGWRAYLLDESVHAIFTGSEWTGGAVAFSSSGAVSLFEAVEIEHDLTAGTNSTTVEIIPANTLVFGVTGRVTETIGGSASSFEIGVSGAGNRYGSGLGMASGSYVHGLTGSPLAYYSGTELELTATGGSFNGTGKIRLVVHIFRMTLPD